MEGEPISKVLAEFKKFKGADFDEKFESVELWTSDGGRQSVVRNLLTPKAHKQQEERKVRADAEAKSKSTETNK